MTVAAVLQMELHTAVGDALLFRALSGHEEISRLFEYQIVAVSEDRTISADDLLGTAVALSLEVAEDSKRWFHGIVTGFGIEGVDGRLFSYRITARPWLWLLTRAANVRIFQEMTVPDIVKQIFDGYGGVVVDQLSGSHAARGYCVQYRESDFNFISRLLEEEGIFYFFRHAENKHELVLADAPGAHQVQPGFATVQYLEDERAMAEQQAIRQWRMRHEVQTGKLTLRDYNFETPGTDLGSATEASNRRHAEAAYEVYDYPGRYPTKAAGDALAKIRLEELEGRFGRFSGAGNTPGLAAGARFTLQGHPRDDQNAEYIVLSTQIELRQAAYESGVGGETGLRCSFSVQRASEPLRPARLSPKPVVAGPQTAVVVGQGDAGDIVTDQYGRVKVQFHWDRLGRMDANSSCWVRVASPWAGNGFGMIALPRLGQEVVVDFLEGDPDQPLITGRVHNAEQLPPYALPDHATVSTIKSRSKQGQTDAFNELRFEDKAGEEYLLLHAQKDRIEFVENTLKSQIDLDEHRTVKQHRKEKIEGEYHLSVVGDVKQKFDAKLSTHAAQDMLLKTDGLFSLKVANDITAESGAAVSLKSGADLHLKIGANIGADAAQNIHLKGGMNIVIEGGMQVTIKAGGSSIVLGPDGVSITGTMVKINSGGSPGSGSGASPVAPTEPDAPEAPELPEDPLTHR